MLDGRYGERMNRIWDFLARGLAAAGWSPNTITITGLILVAAGAAAYGAHRNSLVFGLWLAISFAFDGLDGAVARLTRRTTKFGGYLDAVVDRYQELIVLAAIAWVNDLWPQAFFVVTGSLLTSYNKARVAVEIPIDNRGWPDLFERLERLIFVVAILLLDAVIDRGPGSTLGVLSLGLMALGVLSHLTAVQRIMRARHQLVRASGSLT